MVLLFMTGQVSAQDFFQDMPPGFEAVTDAEIPWISGPDYPGSELAFLYGNPAEPGFYVMRVKFLSGTMSTPHYHDKDRFITVLQGTWWVGMSNDLGDIEPMNPGGFMVHPAGAVHFDGSVTGETIVEVRGMGPVLSTSVPSTGSRD
jgi:quercetin dioxygenase-like cupin family protein